MASIILAQAIWDRHILVKGSKDRFRDFVYVDDVVRGVLSASRRESGYEVYNICTGKPQTIEKVIQEIQKNLEDYPVSVKYTSGTPGDQFGLYGSYMKIHEALGREPLVTFEEDMKMMTEWAIRTMR